MLAPHCGFLHRSHPSHLVYIYQCLPLTLTIIPQPSHPRHLQPTQWTASTTPIAWCISHTPSPLAHRYYFAQVLTIKSSTTVIRKNTNLCSTLVNHLCSVLCNPSFPLNTNIFQDNAHQHGQSHIPINRSSWTTRTPTTSVSFAPALPSFPPSSKQS